jgi:hypothetical protein
VEVGLQSYSDRFGARHHFEFTVGRRENAGLNPTMLYARPPRGDWDVYTFTDPIKDIHGLTLQFRNPDHPVSFLPDVFYGVPLTYATAGGTSYLQLNLPAGHGLRAGDRVFVTGCATGRAPPQCRPAGEAVTPANQFLPVCPAGGACPVPPAAFGGLDAYVNRPEGHVLNGSPAAPLPPGAPIATPEVWTDPAIDIQNFLPLLAQAALRPECPQPFPQTVNVYVAKRRLRIPLRVRRVVPRLTNYISL